MHPDIAYQLFSQRHAELFAEAAHHRRSGRPGKPGPVGGSGVRSIAGGGRSLLPDQA